MKTDKPILVIAGHVGSGCTGLRASAELLIASMKEKHPDLIVVDNVDDIKKLDLRFEHGRDRGITINSVEQFNENSIPIKNYHQYVPLLSEVKITHAGEQVKSARNIRREQQRKAKKRRW